jgi:hypothetical protein
VKFEVLRKCIPKIVFGNAEAKIFLRVIKKSVNIRSSYQGSAVFRIIIIFGGNKIE